MIGDSMSSPELGPMIDAEGGGHVFTVGESGIDPLWYGLLGYPSLRRAGSGQAAGPAAGGGQ